MTDAFRRPDDASHGHDEGRAVQPSSHSPRNHSSVIVGSPPEEPLSVRVDLAYCLFVATLVIVVNSLYISDLFLLWHDDVTSYYTGQRETPLQRPTTVGDPVTERHPIVDGILAHVLVDVSPLVARILVILTAVAPATVIGYLAARTAFRLSPAAAAVAAVGPFILTAQWEVIVGVNLSYVVYDLLSFYICIAVLAWSRNQVHWGAILIASAWLYITITEAIGSMPLLGPALLWCALFVRPNGILKSLPILTSVAAASLYTALEQGGSSRALWRINDAFLERLLQHLATPIDDILPGGVWVAGPVTLFATAAVIVAVALAIRRTSFTTAAALGVAGGLYFFTIFAYVLTRPGFPNRYYFLPVAGLCLAVGVAVHFMLRGQPFGLGRIVNKLGFKAEVGSHPFGAPAALVLAVLMVLGAQKAHYVEPIIAGTDRFAKMARAYFYMPEGNRMQSVIRLERAPQVIIVAEGGVPVIYGYRMHAAGYVRFITGRNDIFGFAGRRRVCANPFQPWDDWAAGPGGFDSNVGIRIVGFDGENGNGRELHHLLATDARALDVDGAPQSWRLYQTGPSGAEVIATGDGAAALAETLEQLGLEAHDVAYSCSI